MPKTTIPLVGTYTTRPGVFISSSVSYDQRFINALFEYLPDKYTQSANAYLVKRPGMLLALTPSAGNSGTAVHRTGGEASAVITAFGLTNSTIFFSSTNCGTITGVCYNISEGYLNNEQFYFFTSTDNTGWYLPGNAANDGSPTFTANTTSGSPVLTNVSSVTNVYVGQALSGTGIDAGARVLTIDSATQITMTSNATANGTGVTVTWERIAKIISANFPSSNIGQFVVIDGYVCIADDNNRRVYSSNLNSITNWNANDYFPFDQEADVPVTCIKHNNKLLVLGRDSFSFYLNTGNPSGSPFSLIKELTSRIGCRSGIKPFATVGNSVFWVGGGHGYAICAWEMKDMRARVFSNSAINRKLSSSIQNYIVSAFAVDGNQYMLVSGDLSILMGPDMQYSEQSMLSGSGNIVASGAQSISLGVVTDLQAIYVVDGTTSGKVYRTDVNTYQDDGSAFTMTIQLEPKVLNGGSPFTIKSIDLLADDQASGSTTLEISGNDYASFATIGTFDMTSTRKRIHRCGYYRSHFIPRLTHSANTAWRGQAIVVDWEPAG